MARKIPVKLIIQLHECDHLSGREIARTRKIGRDSVSDVISIASDKNITYESIKDKSNEEAYRMIYPDKYSYENIYKEVDYDYVHIELSKTV